MGEDSLNIQSVLATLMIYRAKMLLVGPLSTACLAVVISISVFAAKGRLHIPGYLGIAFLAFGSSLLFGNLAGNKAIRGTVVAVVLSIAFYLCIATAVGSVVALLFYRERPEI
jgi:hypothetical protein